MEAVNVLLAYLLDLDGHGCYLCAQGVMVVRAPIRNGAR